MFFPETIVTSQPISMSKVYKSEESTVTTG